MSLSPPASAERDVPRYDTLGLLCGRRAQVGDLSRLELRQRRLATERPAYRLQVHTHTRPKRPRPLTLERRSPNRSC